MFTGIITPIVTPFNRDSEESINYDAMKQLVDHLIDHGVSGIFPLGSNGEFHVLSAEERNEFAGAVIKHVDGRVLVYVGTGACSTKEAVDLAQQAELLGADALSVITPYFIKPNDEELIGYYRTIATSVKIPIILYNIPGNTGLNISPKVLEALKDLPNVQGIKDSSGNLENVQGYLDVAKNSQIHVLIGSDSKIFTAYQMGATGAIAGTSNLITDVLVKLDKAFRDGDLATAEKLQGEIEPLRNVLHLGTVPSMLKRSIELANIAEVGPARKPVVESTPATDVKVKEMLKYYQLLK